MGTGLIIQKHKYQDCNLLTLIFSFKLCQNGYSYGNYFDLKKILKKFILIELKPLLIINSVNFYVDRYKLFCKTLSNGKVISIDCNTVWTEFEEKKRKF